MNYIEIAQNISPIMRMTVKDNKTAVHVIMISLWNEIDKLSKVVPNDMNNTIINVSILSVIFKAMTGFFPDKTDLTCFKDLMEAESSCLDYKYLDLEVFIFTKGKIHSDNKISFKNEKDFEAIKIKELINGKYMWHEFEQFKQVDENLIYDNQDPLIKENYEMCQRRDSLFEKQFLRRCVVCNEDLDYYMAMLEGNCKRMSYDFMCSIHQEEVDKFESPEMTMTNLDFHSKINKSFLEYSKTLRKEYMLYRSRMMNPLMLHFNKEDQYIFDLWFLSYDVFLNKAAMVKDIKEFVFSINTMSLKEIHEYIKKGQEEWFMNYFVKSRFWRESKQTLNTTSENFEAYLMSLENKRGLDNDLMKKLFATMKKRIYDCLLMLQNCQKYNQMDEKEDLISLILNKRNSFYLMDRPKDNNVDKAYDSFVQKDYMVDQDSMFKSEAMLAYFYNMESSSAFFRG